MGVNYFGLGKLHAVCSESYYLPSDLTDYEHRTG